MEDGFFELVKKYFLVILTYILILVAVLVLAIYWNKEWADLFLAGAAIVILTLRIISQRKIRKIQQD